MAGTRCMRCGVAVGWVGLFVDAGLVMVKLGVGLQTGSRAMMADALYSVIDVVSAALVIASLKVSRKGVDQNHPYGHGKVEFLAVATVSLFVAVFAVIILHRVVVDLGNGGHQALHPIAAAAAALSVVACWGVYRYADCAGRKLNSPIILTHAEHNKADALSSLAVFVSIVLSWVGLGVLDPIVAGLEIIHIMVISFTLLRAATHGLLDASSDPTQVRAITAAARGVAGVIGVEDVRVRSLGSVLWVELIAHIGAKRRMSEAGAIRASVRAAIFARFDHIANVMVDVQPAIARGQLIGTGSVTQSKIGE